MSLEAEFLLVVASAGFLFLTLLGIGLLHALWGLGVTWPRQDQASLAGAVVGRRGLKRMPPPLSCFIVAAALVIAALWPLASIGALPTLLPPSLHRLLGWVFCLVFIARGIAAYLPAWRRLVPVEPFARLDRTLYGPLCLALGVGFLVLLV